MDFVNNVEAFLACPVRSFEAVRLSLNCISYLDCIETGANVNIRTVTRTMGTAIICSDTLQKLTVCNSCEAKERIEKKKRNAPAM